MLGGSVQSAYCYLSQDDGPGGYPPKWGKCAILMNDLSFVGFNSGFGVPRPRAFDPRCRFSIWSQFGDREIRGRNLG